MAYRRGAKDWSWSSWGHDDDQGQRRDDWHAQGRSAASSSGGNGGNEVGNDSSGNEVGNARSGNEVGLAMTAQVRLVGRLGGSLSGLVKERISQNC